MHDSPAHVSIIVPVSNGRSIVERLMKSLGAQTHRAVEVLIVDNGSEDGAPEAAERWGRVSSVWDRTPDSPER